MGRPTTLGSRIQSQVSRNQNAVLQVGMAKLQQGVRIEGGETKIDSASRQWTDLAAPVDFHTQGHLYTSIVIINMALDSKAALYNYIL